jgi:CRP-like cAMP-binding protein
MLVEALKSVPLFEDMTEEELGVLGPFIEERCVTEGEAVFSAGSSDRNLYLIKVGILEVCKEGPTGRPQVLATLQDGDQCGEMGFLDERKHSVSVVALTDAVIFVLDHDKFETLIESHPRLVYKLVKGIVFKVHDIVREMNNKHVEMADYMFTRVK